MELFVLSLGECCCTYQVIAPNVDDDARIHIPVLSYLIRRDDGTHVLVDTGMSRLHVDDPDLTFRGTEAVKHLRPTMRPEDTLLFRLAELGVAPQEIEYVVNTHLHFDHAGNNDLLGNATFFVQREQYDVAKDNPSFPNQYWNLPALHYELVDGEQQLFDGISVIPTPGHVPGHQSVHVTLPETGSMILCGDAIYCQENIDHDSWDSQGDPVVAKDSAMRLLDLAQRESAQVIFGHDRNQAPTLLRSPSSYR